MNMTTAHKACPTCFGELDIVFPECEDGLRCSPDTCLACEHKTECLRTAMKGKGGLRIRGACLDRAYAAGMVGFLERWSKKKEIHRKLQDKGAKDK
jgi:hypothetical protein